MSNSNENLLQTKGIEVQHAAQTSRSPKVSKPIFCGHYEQEDIIGGGSFGHVYKCRNIKTGKVYAVK